MRQLILKRTPRLSKRKRILLLKKFIEEVTATQTSIDLKININTAHLYFNHFREKIFYLLSKTPRFDGEVEMDQGIFGRNTKTVSFFKQREVARELYGGADWKIHVPRRRRKKKKYKHILVFGIYKRGSNVYTHIIEKADKNTLFPIIRQIVEPGSVIFTDGWAGFVDLKKEGYIHHTTIHSRGIEDLRVGRSGVNTSGIDKFWDLAKEKIGDFRGYRRRTFALHLKECEWRWNHRIYGESGPKEKARKQKEMLKELKKILKNILK